MEKSLSVYQVVNDGTFNTLSDLHLQDIKSFLNKSNLEVLVFSDIIKRQIWIWMGSNAPVRKKFISSRVANQLRFEIGAVSNTQSIDQGDEPNSFWEFINVDNNKTKNGLSTSNSSKNVEFEPLSEPPDISPTPIQPSKRKKKPIAVIKPRKSTPIKPKKTKSPKKPKKARISAKKKKATKKISSKSPPKEKETSHLIDDLTPENYEKFVKNIGDEVEKRFRKLLKESGLVKD